MTFLQNIEDIAKTQSSTYLKHLLKYYGIPIQVHKPVENTASSVYGRAAGQNEEASDEVIGIVVGDDFFPSDGISYGTFEEGFLYTDSEIPNVGDKVSIERPGVQKREYNIQDVQSLGTSTSVFKRFKLSAVG